jgi:hypothetical protein
LPFFRISISLHYSTYFSSIISISFHNFALYFPNVFTIQLIFFCMFQEWKDMKIIAEKEVE